MSLVKDGYAYEVWNKRDVLHQYPVGTWQQWYVGCVAFLNKVWIAQLAELHKVPEVNIEISLFYWMWWLWPGVGRPDGLVPTAMEDWPSALYRKFTHNILAG